MIFDRLLLKLSALVIVQQLIGIFKNNITRWLIKTFFTKGELVLNEWFTWSFISSLDFSRIGSLILIASFTLITFPLGIWISSYSVGHSYPIIRMIGIGTYIVTFPISIYIMVYRLQEMVINTKTQQGIIITILSYSFALFGAWLMYLGGKQ